jgi:hypothetical protein
MLVIVRHLLLMKRSAWACVSVGTGSASCVDSNNARSRKSPLLLSMGNATFVCSLLIPFRSLQPCYEKHRHVVLFTLIWEIMAFTFSYIFSLLGRLGLHWKRVYFSMEREYIQTGFFILKAIRSVIKRAHFVSESVITASFQISSISPFISHPIFVTTGR